jgi:flagellar capping protein FliD
MTGDISRKVDELYGQMIQTIQPILKEQQTLHRQQESLDLRQKDYQKDLDRSF